MYTITIFDWDDTFLPSSHINVPEAVWPTLESVISKLLDIALEKGSVFIVTGSYGNWVESSCKQYFPSLWEKIQDIPVFAQDVKNDKHPMVHKFSSFETIVQNNLEKKKELQLVSIGDGPIERCAALKIQKKYNIQVKTIKMIDYPPVFKLTAQLELLITCLNTIYELARSLDTVTIFENVLGTVTIAE